MIELTKLTGEKYYINSELVEMIEMIPDTLITMSNGKTHYVLEPAADVVTKIGGYRAGILAQAHLMEKVPKENRRRRNDNTREE